MAAFRTAFHFRTSFNDRNTNSLSRFTSKTSLNFCNSTLARTLAHTINPNSACAVRRMYVLHALKHNREDCFVERNETALDMFVKWFQLIRDAFPGGRWWDLRDFEQNVDVSPSAAEPVTVLKALRKMWALVADEKWILYTALGALTVAAVSEISMPGILAGYQKKAALLAQNCVASSNEVAEETLSLMRTIRAYGTEKEEFQRFTQWIERLASVGMRESVAYGLWTLSFSTLYRSTQVLAVLFGGMSILSGHVSAEQLTKYVFYCEWLIYAAWRLQDSMSSLLQSLGACEKVFQLMHLPSSCEFLSKGVKLRRLTGCVDFVNVSFHHSSRKMVPILEYVNFSLKANEVVAIVGVSGSGKSSLINLLLGLYEPINGEIFVNGIPLGEMDIRWLRENMGYVGQEPHLFHTDVKSNICYGCPRSIGQEEIESAAKSAYAHEFISALPNGYDTIISDNLLSGGEKQRIAIARALLRDPIFLVFDEATSALDAESEGYIKEIIQSLKNDTERLRSIIIVSQRLSTIKAADRILVLNHGRVVETGNYLDLVNANGVFARLFKLETDTRRTL